MARWKSAIYAFAIVCAELLVAVLLLPVFIVRLLYSVAGIEPIIIWTGTPILTLARKAAAERSLGVKAISIVRRAYYISNDFDVDLYRLARGNGFVAFALTYVVFIWICVVAKRVHTFADGGLLPSTKLREFSFIELSIYKLLRIQHFVWVYGADVRVRQKTMLLGEPNCCTNCTSVEMACICSQAKADRNMKRLAKSAVAILSMGDMIEYTPGSRNNLFFWPLDLSANGGHRYRPVYPDVDEVRSLRVVHAPNHREFKGTAHLEVAVEQLLQEGIKIELVLVEKMPNEQALEIYRSADLIFDQCMIGFHGYFALEAMALGKPVMCFIRRPNTYLLAPEECPIINTHVTTLMQDLRYYAQEGRSELPQLGRLGRVYIEKYYTEQAFAGRLMNAYKELKITP